MAKQYNLAAVTDNLGFRSDLIGITRYKMEPAHTSIETEYAAL